MLAFGLASMPALARTPTRRRLLVGIAALAVAGTAFGVDRARRALGVAVFSIAWHALRLAGTLDGTPPGVREAVTLLLPPQGALLAIETAFAQQLAIPWPALLWVALYGALLLLLAGISIAWREL